MHAPATATIPAIAPMNPPTAMVTLSATMAIAAASTLTSGSLSNAANAAAAGTNMAACAPKSMRLSYHPPIRIFVAPVLSVEGSPCRYGTPTGPIYWYSAHNTQMPKLAHRISASLRNSPGSLVMFEKTQLEIINTTSGLSAPFLQSGIASLPPSSQKYETKPKIAQIIVAGAGNFNRAH